MKIIVIAGFAESLIIFRRDFLTALVAQGHEVIACAPEDDASVVARLNQIGVTYQNCKLTRASINPLNDLRTLFDLTARLKRTKPDIVFSYTIKPVIFGSIAARLAGVSEIYSMVTGLGYAFSGKGLKRRAVGLIAKTLYRFGLSRNRRVFFQNPDDLALFQTLGLLRSPDQGVLVNGSGVDLTLFAAAPLPSSPSFLLIARLLIAKGVREYVDAARRVKARQPDVRFRLVGWRDENPESISKSELDSWVKEGVVEYLGKLDDVRSAIADSCVFVLPSYYPEGTPRTVLESMSMGRPIITTDSPGCRETVVDGSNGFLIPIRDAAALAERMWRFIENPGIIRQMGSESRRIAEVKYDVHKVNQALLENMGLL